MYQIVELGKLLKIIKTKSLGKYTNLKKVFVCLCLKPHVQRYLPYYDGPF